MQPISSTIGSGTRPKRSRPVFDAAHALGFDEAGDPFGGGAQDDAAAGEARADPERDAQRVLPSHPPRTH
jgi:hypothetical protein